MNHRVMFIRPIVIMMFASLMLAALAANASPLVQVPTLGLTMSVDHPKAVNCMIWPLGQEDEQACEGFDVGAARANLQSSAEIPAYFAFVRIEEWSFGVAVTPMSMAPFTEEQISNFVAGIERGSVGLARGERAGRRFDVIELRDVQGFRTRFVMRTPGEQYNQSIMYVLVGRSGSALIHFVFNEGDASRMAAVVEGIIDTVEMPPYKQEHFGQSKHYLIGYYGASLGLSVIGITIGLVVAVVQMHRKRRREAATRNAVY